MRKITREKAVRKFRYYMVTMFRKTLIYPYLYRSYWHSLFCRPQNKFQTQYFAAKPNPGAGIGHQMANWIAGYWFARFFGLNFAHIPFAEKKWEEFLGFGEGERTVNDLKKIGYRIVRIQLFDEKNSNEVERIKKIITSYSGKKVIFLAEQDQFYEKQYGVMNDIQKKFYQAPARSNDKCIYDKNCFNIALHIRRGDIVQSDADSNSNLSMRYQKNEYFFQALKTVLGYFENVSNIHIYIFSQGTEEEFQEFREFSNLTFCLNMGAQESFLHMVYADVLITSKSSFSYKPALLNKGLKFCPDNFWHGYPKTSDWILLDEHGYIVEKGSLGSGDEI